jgi:hypothetical protein
MSNTITTTAFKSGQRVRIIDAEPGNADPKALVYYNFYRNLIGSVMKVYDDGTMALSIDRRSLQPEIRERHEQTERVLRDKWLNGLSEEERNKLTQKEQRFSLNYMLLVSSKYVVPDSGDAGSAKSKASTPAKQPNAAADTSPARPSLADLEAAEEQYLNSKLQS